MKIYRNGTGEKYTPSSHYEMTTQVIFNPDGGCKKANITLSTLKKGTGSNDEDLECVYYAVTVPLLDQTHSPSGGRERHVANRHRVRF